MIKLHYATFGGVVLKFIYFLLSMITCFMIISGILLWQAARDNDQYTLKQRKFHDRVTRLYLGIYLGMFPSVAFFFAISKATGFYMENGNRSAKIVFYICWLILTLVAVYGWKSYRRINSNFLLTGGIISLMVPLANGIFTGDWFWESIQIGFYDVAAVDLFWLFTGLLALGTCWFTNRKKFYYP
ncbi:MAG: hypothetical protein ACI9QN_001312 [Arcticibacterium sp.]